VSQRPKKPNMVFDNLWFRKYQKALLWLANTGYGRDVLAINGSKSEVRNNKILAILPNAIAWKEDGIYRAEFRTHNKYSKRLFYEYNLIWRIIHAWDTKIANLYLPRLNLGFDTLTVYPDPHTETTTVDGRVYRSGVNEAFATIIAGAGTGVGDAAADNIVCNLAASATSNQFAQLIRGVFLFDTSALGASDISAATLSLNGGATELGGVKTNGLGSPDLHIAGATTASNTALSNSDYANVGGTSFGSVTYANIQAVDSYTDWSLNASGIANISKSGVSKFSLRHSWDINGSFTGTWASGAASHFGFRLAETAGTTKDPKLVVTYTPLEGQFLQLL